MVVGEDSYAVNQQTVVRVKFLLMYNKRTHSGTFVVAHMNILVLLGLLQFKQCGARVDYVTFGNEQ